MTLPAIIIEPIQGEGGDNQFRPEFFRALRQLADENEAMLIMDEVQTGIGMTGKMWAHQHFVEPDMIAFGKKMQVCGFLCGPAHRRGEGQRLCGLRAASTPPGAGTSWTWSARSST